eukprot:gene4071-4318_t
MAVSLMVAAAAPADPWLIMQQQSCRLGVSPARPLELLPIAEGYVSNASGAPCQVVADGAPSTAEVAANSPATAVVSQQAAVHGCGLADRQRDVGEPLLLPGQLQPLDLGAVLHELCSYSVAIAAAVPSVQMARQEFAWRNGFFLQQGATPVHGEWLRRAGCSDLLARQSKVGQQWSCDR